MVTQASAAAAEAGVRTYRPRLRIKAQDTDDRGSDRLAVTLFSELSLEHLIVSTACQPEFTTVFKASAPDWNRSFQWRGVDLPNEDVGSLALQTLIQSSFSETGDGAALRDSTMPSPTAYRWTWLALNGVLLKVVAGATGGQGFKAAANYELSIDQWQSAYFLDFGNQPRSRLRRLLHRLMHWRFSLSHFGMT